MAIPHPSLNIVFRGLQPAKLGYGGPLVFSRATIGSYNNEAGLLAYAASGVLRHGWHPITGAYLGALIEPLGTNLSPRSQELGHAAWTLSGTSASDNAATAPDGTMTGDKLIENSAVNVTHFCRHTAGMTITGGATMTYSRYAHAAERSRLRLRALNGSFANGYSADFNLAAGTWGNGVAYGTGTFTKAYIEALRDGWYRCSITGVIDASSTDCLGLTYLDNGTGITYTGDGSSGLHLWGDQMEPGGAPSSYIPTTGSAATRNADNLSLPVSAFGLHSGEGTWLAEFIQGPLNGYALDVDSGSNDYLGIVSSGGSLYASLAAGGVTQADINLGAIAEGTVYRAAMAYGANNVAAALNGSLGTPDLTATVPAFTTVRLGASRTSSLHLGSYLRRIAYFARRQAQTDLQNLTL